MLPREHVERILYFAAQAPSGDNAQPWRFEVHGDIVEVFNIPGEDYSPYNFRERGSLFANGAAIENAIIAATTFGYNAEVDFCPVPSNKNLIARLTFHYGKQDADPLASYIESRSTNRKHYKAIALSKEHKKQLVEVFGRENFGELRLIEDSLSIQKCADLLSLSDQLIFEEKSIHDAIFGSIRWSRMEEQKHSGMYVKTLELPPPAEILFKSLKHWSWLVALNKVGISKFIASQSASGYSASGAIGLFMMPNDLDKDYIRAGCVFEKLWLVATELGLSIQPVTALFYLAGRIAAGDPGDLTDRHIQQIRQTCQEILKLFENPQGTVAIIFRMGYADQPSARSFKKQPQINFS
jgi:nitroreductase